MIPKSAQTCSFGMVEQMTFSETKNGSEWGVIWSNRGETVPRLQEISRRIFFDGSQGAWGLGLWEQVGTCVIFGILLDIFGLFEKANET